MLGKVKDLLGRLKIAHEAMVEIDLKESRSMATFIVDGAKAESIWRELAAVEGDSLLTPLILGGADSFEAHLETLGLAYDEPDLSVAEILAESREIDFDDFMAARLEDYVYEPGTWPDDLSLSEDSDANSSASGSSGNAASTGSSDNPADSGSAGKEHRGKGIFESERDIYIGLVEQKADDLIASYELPVWLLFGGFGDCPQPYQHPAVLKHWLKAHQARLIAIGSDYLQCQVPAPPRDQEAAMRLAREHFAYSKNPVEQGPGQLAPYAAQLLKTSTWNFWWE